MNEEHSLVGPSSLRRRFLCPGSREMEEVAGQEKTSSAAAEKGAMLHQIMAEYAMYPEKTDAKISELEADDREAINACIDLLHSLMRERSNSMIKVEKKIDMSVIDGRISHGTPDLVFVQAFDSAVIVDWKFTHMMPLPAKYNIQLAAYAVAVAEEYECDEIRVILFTAYDQRKSEYLYNTEELRNARRRIRQIVSACMGPCAPLIPGEEQCRYCSAATRCTVLLDATNRSVKGVPEKGLSASELGRMMDIAEPAAIWCGHIKKAVIATIESGADVPGWGMREGRSMRVWRDEVTERILLDIAEELEKPTDGIVKTTVSIATPAQVEKLWGKAKPVREAMTSLITSKPGKPKLMKIKEDQS